MRRRPLLTAVAALGAGAPAAAQPATRPITLVSGYSPGGSTDIAARLLVDPLVARLPSGSRIVVENRPGASGAIAAEWLRRQSPDGTTLMVAETGSQAIAPAATPNWSRYDPIADFTHLGVIAAPPLVLCVRRDFPAADTAGVLARLRTAPRDGITYATSGVGGILHLATEMLAQELGTRFVHVPYRSGAQMMQAIHTAEADFGIAALASANAMMRDGLVRPVAVTGQTRFPTWPDLPTLSEGGLAGFDFTIWYVLIAPAGVPEGLRSQLNGALRGALADPALRQRMLTAGFGPWEDANDPAAAEAFTRAEIDKYRQVVRRTGVRLEG